MRAAGASDTDVFALREREFGSEAAERLALLDARRTAWRTRLDAYRTEREALLESAVASDPVSRDEALAALRAQHFDAHERLRVRAADEAELRVRAQSGAPRAESSSAR
jgi:lipase chaperone LimK